MERFVRARGGIGALLVTVAMTCSVPAWAECRGGIPGLSQPMCTSDSDDDDDNASGNTNVVTPVINPGAEALRRNFERYSTHLGGIFENTRISLEDFLALPPPRSETELTHRIDGVLARIWPEYRSNTLELGLLRWQSRFYNAEIPRGRDAVARLRERIATIHTRLPILEAAIAGAEEKLAAAERLEEQLQRVEETIANDHSSERRAAASLLVFSPNSKVSAGWLADSLSVKFRIKSVPAREQLQAAARADDADIAAPARLGEFLMRLPGSTASVSDKLAVMRSVSRDMQQNWFELPSMRKEIAAKAAERDAILAEKARLKEQLSSLSLTEGQLEERVDDLNTNLHATNAFTEQSAHIIVTEVVSDMALETGSERLRQHALRALRAARSAVKVPSSRAALLELARRGGKIAMPGYGYGLQWKAFVDVEEQTLTVLDRAEGFMLAAARLAASGSPAEMYRYVDRIFDSVNLQAFEYVKTVGFSAFPEATKEERQEKARYKEAVRLLQGLFESRLSKLRQRQAAEYEASE